MPFVDKKSRRRMGAGGLPETVGDKCYLEYKKLMEAWGKERRWTTVHKELCRMLGYTDEKASKMLAFLEFYIRHAHVYENEKVLENGDIE